jgi:hypothetical protein
MMRRIIIALFVISILALSLLEVSGLAISERLLSRSDVRPATYPAEPQAADLPVGVEFEQQDAPVGVRFTR